MFQEIKPDEFCYKSKEYGKEAMKEITFFYGNFSQTCCNITVNNEDYEIFRREEFKFPGSVSDPLKSLLRNCFGEKTVRRIVSFHPDAIFYEYLGTESFVDHGQPNPEGIFILKFEMALACKS
ncbi:MAG: hypothetical protein ACTSP4_08265 [Candidatus Hodarchaeales archaeon]